jgi:hypothetical protein
MAQEQGAVLAVGDHAVSSAEIQDIAAGIRTGTNNGADVSAAEQALHHVIRETRTVRDPSRRAGRRGRRDHGRFS